MNPVATSINASSYSFYAEDHTIQLPKRKSIDGGGGAGAKIYGRDLSGFDDNDIDDLLDNLTMEELEDLNNEMDPDVGSYVLWSFVDLIPVMLG
jgi:hypothetical protein